MTADEIRRTAQAEPAATLPAFLRPARSGNVMLTTGAAVRRLHADAGGQFPVAVVAAIRASSLGPNSFPLMALVVTLERFARAWAISCEGESLWKRVVGCVAARYKRTSHDLDPESFACELRDTALDAADLGRTFELALDETLVKYDKAHPWKPTLAVVVEGHEYVEAAGLLYHPRLFWLVANDLWG